MLNSLIARASLRSLSSNVSYCAMELQGECYKANKIRSNHCTSSFQKSRGVLRMKLRVTSQNIILVHNYEHLLPKILIQSNMIMHV